MLSRWLPGRASPADEAAARVRDVVDANAVGTNQRKLAARAKRASVCKTLALDQKHWPAWIEAYAFSVLI